MRNVSDKSYTENQNTFCAQLLFVLNHAVYGLMWKNILESDRAQMTVWRMRIAC